MSVTFEVSEVERGTEPLPVCDAATALHRLTALPELLSEPPWVRHRPAAPCAGHGAPARDWVAFDYHPFVAAALAAFDAHRPLVLSPDHVWVLLAQGLSAHIARDPDAVRERLLVEHSGRLLLDVRRDDFVPGADNPWAEVIEELGERIREHVGRRHDLMVCDFSTTGPLERAASRVVMLEAMGHYFRYQVTSVCGIPAITLEGTPDDWRAVRDRARALRELGLDAWVDALEPALDRFVAASEGHADPEIWRSFVKRKSASGGPYLTGWINELLPFVRNPRDGTVEPNRWLADWERGMDTPMGGGPTTEQLPAGLSTAPLEWRFRGRPIPMELLGGFVGVSQSADLALRPELGWAVREVRRGA